MDQDGTSQQPAPLLKAHLSDRNDGSCMEFSTLIRNVQNTARYAKVVPNVPFFVPKHGSRCEAAQTSALKTCDSGGCPHLSTNLHGFTTSYCRPLPDEVARKRQASARRANS